MAERPVDELDDEEEQPADDERIIEALRTTFPPGRTPNDAELRALLETIRDQGTLVTDDGEYSLDEVGALIFDPYPPLDRG